tara:strand:+ start:3106 stop:3399 length:294 start_codon:yes stop_codon:yes gene_type:complete
MKQVSREGVTQKPRKLAQFPEWIQYLEYQIVSSISAWFDNQPNGFPNLEQVNLNEDAQGNRLTNYFYNWRISILEVDVLKGIIFKIVMDVIFSLLPE